MATASAKPSTEQNKQPEYAVNPKLEAETAARMADESVQAAERAADVKREAAERAAKHQEAADKAESEARARATQARVDAENAKEGDDQYLKALNEQDGLTLVPADAVENNPTVKKQGSKVYVRNGAEVVIAKRVEA